MAQEPQDPRDDIPWSVQVQRMEEEELRAWEAKEQRPPRGGGFPVNFAALWRWFRR